MDVQKVVLPGDSAKPLMAVLPYVVKLQPGERDAPSYDPTRQRTVYAAGRNYSTCRNDDSVGFWNSRADTQTDD